MDLLRQQNCKPDLILGELDVNEGIHECIRPSTTTSGSNGCSEYVVNTTMLSPRRAYVTHNFNSTPPTSMGITSCNSIIGLVEPVENHN